MKEYTMKMKEEMSIMHIYKYTEKMDRNLLRSVLVNILFFSTLLLLLHRIFRAGRFFLFFFHHLFHEITKKKNPKK